MANLARVRQTLRDIFYDRPCYCFTRRIIAVNTLGIAEIGNMHETGENYHALSDSIAHVLARHSPLHEGILDW